MQEKRCKILIKFSGQKVPIFFSFFVFLSPSVSAISRRVKNLFVLYLGGTKKA